MTRLCSTVLILVASVASSFPALAAPAPDNHAATQQLTTEQRIDLVRGLQSEFVFIRRTFPMGEKGLTVKDGKVSPDDTAIRNAVAAHGLAARPGDKAQITNIMVRDKS